MIATAEKIAALEAAAEAWKGTSFCEGASVRGAGANCQGACAGIYFDAGWLPRFPVPQGPRDWARGHTRSLIVEWIEGSGLFAAIDPRARAAGDLLGFRVGHTVHHLGIVLGRGRLVHAISGHGVVIAEVIPDAWLKRLEKAWRVA